MLIVCAATIREASETKDFQTTSMLYTTSDNKYEGLKALQHSI